MKQLKQLTCLFTRIFHCKNSYAGQLHAHFYNKKYEQTFCAICPSYFVHVP